MSSDVWDGADHVVQVLGAEPWSRCCITPTQGRASDLQTVELQLLAGDEIWHWGIKPGRSTTRTPIEELRADEDAGRGARGRGAVVHVGDGEGEGKSRLRRGWATGVRQRIGSGVVREHRREGRRATTCLSAAREVRGGHAAATGKMG